KKIIILTLLVGLPLCGCAREAPEARKRAGKGSISGTVNVKKPARAFVVVALARNYDELISGRVLKFKALRKSGPFRFRGLKAGTYRLGAFVDINGNTLPDLSVEPYFILDRELSVSPGEHVENVFVEGFFNERRASFKTPARVKQYGRLMGAAGDAVERAYEKLKAEESDLLFEVMPSLRAMVFEAGMVWVIAGNESDWEHIKGLLEPAAKLAEGAIRGEDLMGSLRGCFLQGYVSEIDGSIQRYAAYVPEAYDGSRPFPLIIALHGAGGDHWAGMKMVAGSSPLAIGAEEWNRWFFPRALPPDFIIACPNGHGYRGPAYRKKGEYDVLKVLKEMFSRYNIDESRVYLTGASKGGGGAWEIGLEYAEMFAAIAPVCGATGLARTMVQNARGLDIFVFHGSKDTLIPAGESRMMVGLLSHAGVPVKYFENEDWGHEAASLVYKDGAIFDLFRG
ncbi:MAG: hypothetical protein HQ583_07595, partial [Candidatus Abyssubacteria bacterium]|nr:hypothetical protein [Candidatus Abyssubacteria bacterium]